MKKSLASLSIGRYIYRPIYAYALLSRLARPPGRPGSARPTTAPAEPPPPGTALRQPYPSRPVGPSRRRDQQPGPRLLPPSHLLGFSLPSSQSRLPLPRSGPPSSSLAPSPPPGSGRQRHQRLLPSPAAPAPGSLGPPAPGRGRPGGSPASPGPATLARPAPQSDRWHRDQSGRRLNARPHLTPDDGPRARLRLSLTQAGGHFQPDQRGPARLCQGQQTPA